MTDTPQQLPSNVYNRWTGRLVYKGKKAKTRADALVEAVKAGASLCEADLSFVVTEYGARLDGARLDGARLDGARLVGASLDGASLDGAGRIKAHALSRVAFAGPVGNAARPVFCFLAQPDDTHSKPYLVFRCGCFIGDEAAYRVRVQEKYGQRTVADKAWRAQCLAAMAACKANARTWPKPAAAKRTKAA